jgi:hypothetical protein
MIKEEVMGYMKEKLNSLITSEYNKISEEEPENKEKQIMHLEYELIERLENIKKRIK